MILIHLTNPAFCPSGRRLSKRPSQTFLSCRVSHCSNMENLESNQSPQGQKTTCRGWDEPFLRTNRKPKSNTFPGKFCTSLVLKKEVSQIMGSLCFVSMHRGSQKTQQFSKNHFSQKIWIETSRASFVPSVLPFCPALHKVVFFKHCLRHPKATDPSGSSCNWCPNLNKEHSDLPCNQTSLA